MRPPRSFPGSIPTLQTTSTRSSGREGVIGVEHARSVVERGNAVHVELVRGWRLQDGVWDANERIGQIVNKVDKL